MKDKQDLSKIQTGDSVAIYLDGTLQCFESVTSTTATIIRTGRGEWRRDNGSMRGQRNRWHSLSMRLVTDADRAELKRNKMLSRITGSHNLWSRLNDRELETVCVILHDAEKRSIPQGK